VRAELAAALEPTTTAAAARALRDQAARSIRALRRQRAVWAIALADLAEASLQHGRGSATDAQTSIRRAEAGLSSVGMNLYAAVARRRQGEWLGDAGQTLVAESDKWMREHGIADPSKMVRMIAP
jgi:eukaryotic-like serine/threonine-protein kinase